MTDLLRNVLIAIENSSEASLAADARRLLDDANPLVRGAAVWALSRLLPRAEFVALADTCCRMTPTRMFVKSGRPL